MSEHNGKALLKQLLTFCVCLQVKRIFLYCLTWSLGGLLDTKDRPAFDADVRAIAGHDAPKKHDADDTLFEYTVNDAGEWVHWSSLVQSWEYPKAVENPKFAQLNIPTLDSTRFDALLTRVAALGKSSLLVGGPGTAKTTVINMFMAKFPVEEVASKVRLRLSVRNRLDCEKQIYIGSAACWSCPQNAVWHVDTGGSVRSAHVIHD